MRKLVVEGIFGEINQFFEMPKGCSALRSSVLKHYSYGLSRSRQEISSSGEQIDGCCQDPEPRAVLLQSA